MMINGGSLCALAARSQASQTAIARLAYASPNLIALQRLNGYNTPVFSRDVSQKEGNYEGKSGDDAHRLHLL